MAALTYRATTGAIANGADTGWIDVRNGGGMPLRYLTILPSTTFAHEVWLNEDLDPNGTALPAIEAPSAVTAVVLDFRHLTAAEGGIYRVKCKSAQNGTTFKLVGTV
jgi:hypothetical protein